MGGAAITGPGLESELRCARAKADIDQIAVTNRDFMSGLSGMNAAGSADERSEFRNSPSAPSRVLVIANQRSDDGAQDFAAPTRIHRLLAPK
jgi:hypothetical protein